MYSIIKLILREFKLINKGFIYEEKINKKLKTNNLQKKSFISAGSDPNAPDAILKYEGTEYKIEIKLNIDADFGQGSLDYDTEENKWIISGSKTKSGEEMKEFLSSINLSKIVNNKWKLKGAPRKFTVSSKLFTQEDVMYDILTFKSFFVDIPSKSVAKYYNSKETYYMQIGGQGLYYMGKDIANLGVPELNLRLKLRVRLKRGGPIPLNNYRFTTAIKAVKLSLKKSDYDLDDDEFLKKLSTRNQKNHNLKITYV